MRFFDDLPPPDPRDGLLLPHRIQIEVRQPTEAEVDLFIRRLLDADWDSPNSAIQLAEDLTLDEVKHVLFFDQVRRFLRLMDENKGAPLTATGNLNRAYVAQMIEKMDWIGRTMKPILARGLFKVVSEYDVQPLQVIHGVCEYGKLIRKRRNRVYVSSLGRELCADGQAGRLYRHLFLTLFRNFDLDFLSCYRDTPLVQCTMAVILWRLRTVARDWVPLDQLPREVYLTAVHDQTRSVSSLPTADADVLRYEVLEPLVWFGLLECDQPEGRWYEGRPEPKFRKTPLFDRFLSFDW